LSFTVDTKEHSFKKGKSANLVKFTAMLFRFQGFGNARSDSWSGNEGEANVDLALTTHDAVSRESMLAR
jgi:hypothetical protein